MSARRSLILVTLGLATVGELTLLVRRAIPDYCRCCAGCRLKTTWKLARHACDCPCPGDRCHHGHPRGQLD